jgi:hypothetical protein
MALTSPGVEVTIIDQSQYLPAPTNSVPLVVLATAQNKADASGTGVAAATTAANAGKLYQVTSQRDLVNLYGSPFFYTTTNGTPIQGYELNEYGLLAAYSLLGVTNRCYVLRADIDLASLVGQTGRPTGAPANGTYWLDTATTSWGIFEFNATTGKFVEQTPIVITDSANLTAGVPLTSIGNIGDYAVNALEQSITESGTVFGSMFYKDSTNAWVAVGSNTWRGTRPTVQGSQSNPELNAGDTFFIGIGDSSSLPTKQPLYTATITVPDDGGGAGSVEGVATEINDLGWSPTLTASVVNGKLCIYSRQNGDISSTPTTYNYITLSNDEGTALADMGFVAGSYFQPMMQYGTAAQMPLWSASQTYARPTGSVWVKVGAAGNGLNPVMSVYNSTLASWTTKNVVLATSDAEATVTLDPTGGKSIPAGTVYGQYNYYGDIPNVAVYFWERTATGPTVITGSDTTPTFTSGPYYMLVGVSSPNSSQTSLQYEVTVPDNATASGFATAWAAAGIPYTTCSVTTEGSIQITHTLGGEIYMSDFVDNSFSQINQSNGLIEAAGFVIGTTAGAKYGFSVDANYSSVVGTVSPSGGTLATFDVRAWYGQYRLNGSGVSSGGSGYSVGDTITIAGANLGGTTPANNLVVQVTEVGGSGAIEAVVYKSGTTPINLVTELSNWREFTYISNEGAPNVAPVNNTNWFYSVVDQVDIMINTSTGWQGYRTVNYDSNGFPSATGSNVTDPNGPIVSASIPTLQSDGTALQYGDIWIDTSDLENYPVISRWQSVDGVDQWVLIDNTDQTSSQGVVFADARWATNGNTNVYDDPIPTITSLLLSNYLDLDAPDENLYPTGMLLFNTRRSGYNVKKFVVNYFNNNNFPGDSLPAETDAWVSESGLMTNGAPYMGRKAQRNMVVKSLRSTIDTNTAIRDEDNFFNLMATPNYPELQPNMIVLNADRGETGYIIGDTPLRLADDATAIQAWATNAAGASSTGEDGLVTRNTYMGLFYPSGLAFDLNGNQVVVPSSHMMLRTFLRNDTIAYPWLAAAGTRRGIIDNAASIGYIDAATGEYVSIKTRVGIRDVLYINFINPMVFFTGTGLLNYGNKTSFDSQSALDRTNVARLIAYIRRQLTLAARPFIFEPNDQITRQQIAGVVESLMIDLVAKRGIYDYLVVCDESNNTPARIDRSELWIDVAIEPVKAAEFIYIPVRILNTGELAAL